MRVKLTYFKGWGGIGDKGGKFYALGEYESSLNVMYLIFDEVQALAEAKKLPGLAEGASNYHILIDVPDHPHNYPHLIVA